MKIFVTSATMALMLAMTVLAGMPAKAEPCRWAEDTALYAGSGGSKSAAIAQVDALATAEAEDTCVYGVCQGSTLTITETERFPIGSGWLARGYKTFQCILF